MYERDSLARDTTVKEKNIDYLQNNLKFSEFSIAGEVARYLNISCILAARILHESVDGIDAVLEAVNRYNAVLDDYIIPAVFHSLFDITSELKTEDKELVLLREPKDAGYYEFSAKDDLFLQITILVLLRNKLRRVFMLIPTVSILFRKRNVSCSILQATRWQKCISQACLHRTKVIFPFTITILNQVESGSITRTSLQG